MKKLRIKDLRHTTQRGVTLLEILIVLAIIALVMGFLVGPKVWEQFQGSKVDIAQMKTKQLEVEYQKWAIRNQGCPKLTDLVKEEGQKDPWGQMYVFHCGSTQPSASKKFGASSSGPDTQAGTADDIRSWK